jgi:hypothetical protein
MTGQKFGRLTVLRREGSQGKGATWLCLCDCGTEHVVRRSDLTSGNTKSCGCLRREQASKASLSHGQSGTPTYASWEAMKRRCLNPNSPDYHRYGGRGITVCDRWLSFENFLADMGERAEGTSLGRIGDEGNYEPGNVRWMTPEEQAANRRPRTKAA